MKPAALPDPILDAFTAWCARHAGVAVRPTTADALLFFWHLTREQRGVLGGYNFHQVRGTLRAAGMMD
jgi:hypothetical protein